MAVIESREHSDFVHTLTLTWTTSATTGTITHTTAKFVNGLVDRIAIMPASVATPDSGFSVTILDDLNTDILKSNATSCAQTTPTNVYLDPPLAVDSFLSMTVGGAGTSHSGTVKLFWREN